MTNIAMENGPFIDGLPIKHGDSRIADYPLVNCNIANWKDPPILNGKIHYFDWTIFNSYL